ncbi:KAT8 regulatory NSL complex subunit 3 [Tanacetum coccineum]
MRSEDKREVSFSSVSSRVSRPAFTVSFGGIKIKSSLRSNPMIVENTSRSNESGFSKFKRVKVIEFIVESASAVYYNSRRVQSPTPGLALGIDVTSSAKGSDFEIMDFEYIYLCTIYSFRPKKLIGMTLEATKQCDMRIVKEIANNYLQPPLILVGKSMGLRVSCMVAAEDGAKASAVVFLGYPLKGTKEAIQDAPLLQLEVPTMFVQCAVLDCLKWKWHLYYHKIPAPCHREHHSQPADSWARGLEHSVGIIDLMRQNKYKNETRWKQEGPKL